MLKLITDPDDFFFQLKQKDVRIRRPTVIVLILAIIIAVYQYVLVTKLAQTFPQEFRSFVIVGAYVEIAASFLGMFAIWFILTVIMHGISSFFNPSGNFRRTFEFVGYGFLPSLLGSAVTVPVSAHYILNAELPKISIALLQQNPAIVKSMLSLIPKNIVYSNMLISIAITAWSLLIWSFAVKHAREVELKKAFVCALIPTVLFGAYQVWSLLKFL